MGRKKNQKNIFFQGPLFGYFWENRPKAPLKIVFLARNFLCDLIWVLWRILGGWKKIQFFGGGSDKINLAHSGEVNFNFKDYDKFFNNFYRVRVDKARNLELKHFSMLWVNIWYSDSDQVQIHLLDTNDPPNIYQTPEGEYVTFTVKAPLVSKHMNMIVGHLWWWIKPSF